MYSATRAKSSGTPKHEGRALQACAAGLELAADGNQAGKIGRMPLIVNAS
jgi:hypothetical protein